MGAEALPFKAMRIFLVSELKNHRMPRQAWCRLLEHYLGQLGQAEASLSLLVTHDSGVRALNRRFRSLDQSTDILSFPACEGRLKAGFKGHLGDLALSWPYAKRHFPRFEETLSREVALLLAHGCLHLCGLHHDTPRQEAAMWRRQRQLLNAAGALADQLSLPIRIA
jgi:probable rRNA maturation factor